MTSGRDPGREGADLGLDLISRHEPVVDGVMRNGWLGVELHARRKRAERGQLPGVPLEPALGQPAAERRRIRPDPHQVDRRAAASVAVTNEPYIVSLSSSAGTGLSAASRSRATVLLPAPGAPATTHARAVA
jgi:hypothetical protein